MKDRFHIEPKPNIIILWQTYQAIARINKDFEEMTLDEFKANLDATEPDARQSFIDHLMSPEIQMAMRIVGGKMTIFHSLDHDGMTVGLVGDEVDLSPEPPDERHTSNPNRPATGRTQSRTAQQALDDDDDVSVDQQLWRRRN